MPAKNKRLVTLGQEFKKKIIEWKRKEKTWLTLGVEEEKINYTYVGRHS